MSVLSCAMAIFQPGTTVGQSLRTHFSHTRASQSTNKIQVISRPPAPNMISSHTIQWVCCSHATHTRVITQYARSHATPWAMQPTKWLPLPQPTQKQRTHNHTQSGEAGQHKCVCPAWYMSPGQSHLMHAFAPAFAAMTCICIGMREPQHTDQAEQAQGGIASHLSILHTSQATNPLASSTHAHTHPACTSRLGWCSLATKQACGLGRAADDQSR